MNPPESGSPAPRLRLADPADAPARVLRVNAAGVYDATGLVHAPASILLQLGKPAPGEVADVRTVASAKVLAIGTPNIVDRHPAASAPDLDTLDRPTSILLPGLVNAHAHLDLTHLGPTPHDPVGGFSTFVDRVRTGRLPDGEALAAAVRLGIHRSIRGGVIAIGDIAGAPMGHPSLTPYHTLRDSSLVGVSFLEFFAIGRGEAPGLDRLAGALDVWQAHGGTNEGRAVRLGIQPHAPYSVSSDAYRFAIERAGRTFPLATHLAETLDEREFVAHATGPQRAFLERIGLWQDGLLRHLGQGRRPVGHLLPILRKAPVLCAHLNDLDNAEIEALAQATATAVYCPRASAYFRAPETFGHHRYLDLIKAGVPVALGTDSILNLPPGTDEGEARLSTLDEMRLLFRRDRTDPVTLLAMATTLGARVLGLPDSWVRLGVGQTPRGLVVVGIGDGGGGLAAAFESNSAPEPILLVRNSYCETGFPGV